MPGGLSPAGAARFQHIMTNIIRILDRALNLAVGLLCALILAISVYSLLDNAWLYDKADDADLLQYKPSLSLPLSGGRAELQTVETSVFPDQVAWICFEGTKLDYPVVQGADNYVYLNRDAYGEFSLSGAIFLDYRNAPDFSDPYSILYGHHMEHGKMFGSLDQFLDRTYFDAHRSGTLVTGDAVWRVELFAVVETDASDSVLFLPRGKNARQIIDYAAEKAGIHVRPETEGPILALTTCYGKSYFSRLAVLGVLIAE